MKTVINLILLVAMVASIIVQYNDPDGYVWMVIYGYATIMILNALRLQYNALLLIIGLVGYVGSGVLLLPDNLDGWITNEVARESGGLFVSGFCIAVLIIQMLFQTDSGKPV